MAASVVGRASTPGSDFSLFLTAYDPSDLPGGSVDPLGFERGYLFLADKILPGLTNVADRPRYFSVLCAGAYLADVELHYPQRLQYQRRLDCVLRFERFWALANVLASLSEDGDDLPVNGIRGVTYATSAADRVMRSRKNRAGADFQLLSRQVPYGVVGIYGAVAEGMRLLDRKTLALTPDLGERLAEGFLKETEAPAVLKKAVRENGDVPIARLVDWGRRAHISGSAVLSERLCMKEAMHRDPVRSRMAAVLADHPFAGGWDTELDRLRRLLPALEKDAANADLREAVQAILTYEACYRIAMLGLERLLWLCRSVPAAAVRFSELNADPVIEQVCSQLPSAVTRFAQALDTAKTEAFRQNLDRITDTRRFLEVAAAACTSPADLVQELLVRHSDVQRGKFDRGRRKMPWLEAVGGQVALTMTRVGGLDREATKPSDIAPHPYRLGSADALFAVGEGA